MRATVIPLEALELPAATKSRIFRRRLLVLGGGGVKANQVISLLSEAPFNSIRQIGKPAPGVKEAVLNLVQHHDVTDVVVDWSSQFSQALSEEIYDCLLTLKLRGTRVHDLSAFCERALGRLVLHDHTAHELVLGSHYHFDYRWQAVKRVVDIAVAVGALILTLPLFFGIALAISATSRGPVFYRQERVGVGGRTFSIIKFRSMRVDAEQDGIARFASQSDDRITPVGGFLRRTRIDELPQFLNVLLGDMRVVGPRPERPAFVEKFMNNLPFYNMRHRVKPGITGWAQVKDAYAASEAEAHRKLSRDLYYIKCGSLLMDLEIMARTIIVMVLCRGSR